jgi:hypothetical protein
MEPTMVDPTPSQLALIHRTADKAVAMARGFGLSVGTGDLIDPPTLDTTWANWLITHHRGDDNPNPEINAFGCAFGLYLVERLSLEWKFVTDDQGTSLAIWGKLGDILVFPPNLVAKRYAAGASMFFVEVALWMEERVGEVRAMSGANAGPQRRFRRPKASGS